LYPLARKFFKRFTRGKDAYFTYVFPIYIKSWNSWATSEFYGQVYFWLAIPTSFLGAGHKMPADKDGCTADQGNKSTKIFKQVVCINSAIWAIL